MRVEDRFNVEGIANDVFQEMKEDGEGFDLFSHYWHRIKINLLSRGYEESDVAILQGLVMKNVEHLFGQME